MFTSLISLLWGGFMFMQYAILKKSGSQDLAIGAMNIITAFTRRWRLASVEIHFSVASSQEVTVIKDNILGTNYDTVLERTTLVSASNYVFRPTGTEIFDVGDELNLRITAGGTAVAYATIYGIEC